jgi:hypothetical protein
MRGRSSTPRRSLFIRTWLIMLIAVAAPLALAAVLADIFADDIVRK